MIEEHVKIFINMQNYKIEKDTYSQTPCLKFAVEGNLDEMRKLVNSASEKKDILNFVHKNSGDTPLILAARFGHEHVVSFLLENGSNIELRNIDGKTALHDAAQHGNLQCLEVLLESGAMVDALKRADWYLVFIVLWLIADVYQMINSI